MLEQIKAWVTGADTPTDVRAEASGRKNNEAVLAGIDSPDTLPADNITPENAMLYGAVYAAVKVLSESIASLPLLLYERRATPYGSTGRTSIPAEDHPLYPILSDLFSDEWTSYEGREFGQAMLCLRGNSYFRTLRDFAGRVTDIIPINHKRMQVKRSRTGRIIYRVKGGTMVVPGGEFLAGEGDIWHVRGLGFDGLTGVSPITYARQSIGVGLAAEEYGAKFFSGDAHPRGIISHPLTLNAGAARSLEKSWRENFQRRGGAHNVVVLDEGMNWQSIGISNEDSQFLETRKFQITDVARLFRIPPHVLADLERATHSNIEAQHLRIYFTLSSVLVQSVGAIIQTRRSYYSRRTRQVLCEI